MIPAERRPLPVVAAQLGLSTMMESMGFRGFMALLAISSLPLAGQRAVLYSPFTGTVERIEDGAIRAKGINGSYTFLTGKDTVVWKGQAHRDLTPLRRGEPVRITFRDGPAGERAALTISAVVEFSGEVAYRRGSFVEVRTESGTRAAHITSSTVFAVNARHMEEGERVLITGFDLGDGSVDAIRVTIYNTGIIRDR